MRPFPHSLLAIIAQIKSAPVVCHPEHIRYAQCKLREGSGAGGTEMLRCAQHDKVVGAFLLLPPACHPERSEGSGAGHRA